MAFLEWFSDLGWKVYGLLVAVLALAGALGAWFGGREAEAALYVGQAPTLAELRAQVQRLRRWLALLARWPSPPGGADTALEELEALGRNLRDLARPSSRSERQARDFRALEREAGFLNPPERETEKGRSSRRERKGQASDPTAAPQASGATSQETGEVDRPAR